MDMPPSRYRVVEQGRRLVVIDTLAGEAVHPIPRSIPEMPGEQRRRMEAPRPQDRLAPLTRPAPRGRYAGGEGVGFTTARWFDKEGPRTIRINQEGQTQLVIVLIVVLGIGGVLAALFSWALLLPLAFLLVNTKTRDGLRTAATTWLTALDTSEA